MGSVLFGSQPDTEAVVYQCANFIMDLIYSVSTWQSARTSCRSTPIQPCLNPGSALILLAEPCNNPEPPPFSFFPPGVIPEAEAGLRYSARYLVMTWGGKTGANNLGVVTEYVCTSPAYA